MLELRPIDQTSYDDLVQMYKESFSGFPWFEDLSHSEVEARVSKHMGQRGFAGILGSVDNEPVGASWWNTPTLAELAEEKGPEVARFATSYAHHHLVWERELLVRPRYQGRGYSLPLRKAFLASLELGRTLVLTRMRDDNVGTLKTGEAVGFRPTSIVTPSKKEGAFHRVYYLLVER
ncbi:hypothetical protein HY970_03260 [Candidatus Kaiserbacteria bacterium]|nr:hypothetical protein [Candidatus Kaiserbacteria bacterium]